LQFLIKVDIKAIQISKPILMASQSQKNKIIFHILWVDPPYAHFPCYYIQNKLTVFIRLIAQINGEHLMLY